MYDLCNRKYGLHCDLSSARGTLEDAISGCIHHVSSLEKCIEQLSEGLSSLLEAYILLTLLYPDEYPVDKPVEMSVVAEMEGLVRMLHAPE